MTTSSFVPEPSERCEVPRTATSVVKCELAHGHTPEVPGEPRQHKGRDKAGRWHSWVNV